MQSAQSIGRALYRIVFRGGTPQRIQFSAPLLLTAFSTAVVAAILSGRLLFELSAIEIGLALFTVLSGLYIGAALLTRSVPRSRLRAALLTILLLLATAGVLLMVLIPLQPLDPMIRLSAGLFVLAAVLSGTTNALQFARGGSRTNAALLTLAFAAVLVAFYSVLRWLLETVFS
jgi:hypothetical protein